MSKTIWIVVVLLVLVVAGIIYFNMNTKETLKNVNDNVVEDQITANQETETATKPENIESTNKITITSSGFSPATLEIAKGEAVMFVNKDSSKHWPASAAHPTHKVYPGSDIKKCGTDEQNSIFDACHGLVNGESFSFTFSESGEWRYHDHLNPGSSGVIIVR